MRGRRLPAAALAAQRPPAIHPAQLPPRRLRVERRTAGWRRRSRELLLDCGDGVTLQAFHTTAGDAPGATLAVLLHGWEGSAESQYILSLAHALLDRGVDVARLNLRDHGDTHHLNRELFHSCRLPEVVGAVRRAAGDVRVSTDWCWPASPSAATSCCAPRRRHPPRACDIARAVLAISPLLDPAHDARCARRGVLALSRATSC
jgi:uncharacterized protein